MDRGGRGDGAGDSNRRGKKRSTWSEGQGGSVTAFPVGGRARDAANGFCGEDEEISVDDMEVAYAAALGRTELIVGIPLDDSVNEETSSSEEGSSGEDSEVDSSSSGEDTRDRDVEMATEATATIGKDRSPKKLVAVKLTPIGDGDRVSLDLQPCSVLDVVNVMDMERGDVDVVDGSDGNTSSSEESDDMEEDEDTSGTSSSEGDVLDFEAMKSVIIKMDEEAGDGEEIVSHKEIKTHGLPPAETLDGISVGPEDEIRPAAHVVSIVEGVILAKADLGNGLLSDGSVFCLEDRTLLGHLDDIIGRVEEPSYIFRYTAGEELPETLKPGARLYSVCKYSASVEHEGLYEKGFDPVEVIGGDEEEEEEEFEFSDDDAEERFRRVDAKRKAAETPPGSIQGSRRRGQGGDRGGRNGRGGAQRGGSGPPHNFSAGAGPGQGATGGRRGRHGSGARSGPRSGAPGGTPTGQAPPGRPKFARHPASGLPPMSSQWQPPAAYAPRPPQTPPPPFYASASQPPAFLPAYSPAGAHSAPPAYAPGPGGQMYAAPSYAQPQAYPYGPGGVPASMPPPAAYRPPGPQQYGQPGGWAPPNPQVYHGPLLPPGAAPPPGMRMGVQGNAAQFFLGSPHPRPPNWPYPPQ